LCGCQNADVFGSVQTRDVADRRKRAQDVRDEAAVRRAAGGSVGAEVGEPVTARITRIRRDAVPTRFNSVRSVPDG
jgi:hypothetical protein